MAARIPLRPPRASFAPAPSLPTRWTKGGGGTCLVRAQIKSITTAPIGAAASTSSKAVDARTELEDALLELERDAANYVNLSRLKLALNGLRQKPGSESIRVAVLGLRNESGIGATAKEVAKLLLADPLKEEEEWERKVDGHDMARPMILRVGADMAAEGTISRQSSLAHEINVSSPMLNGHQLDVLLMETKPPAPVRGDGSREDFEDSVLVPKVDIPTSHTGRYTPITTPVHKALIVADGILGAGAVASWPLVENAGVIKVAVNLPELQTAETTALPFTTIDVGSAGLGLSLIRKDLTHAMDYERLWFQSRLPELVKWLKADIVSNQENVTKPPVRKLVASLLQNASASIQRDEARVHSSALNHRPTASPTKHLRSGLDAWAESAHTELQQQLDLAFSGSRWRKLSWWKLFWRVDDIAMLATDMLAQRFLPVAEMSAIHLAGRLEEAGMPVVPSAAKAPRRQAGLETGPCSTLANGPDSPAAPAAPWPTHIPAARAYLQNETVPALQVLAQNLVMQTLGVSGLTTSLGALAYLGNLTTGIYEAGAVAALGVVWSMRNMQRRWEAACRYWEAVVREEGRKAVRDVERDVDSALLLREHDRPRPTPTPTAGGKEDIGTARRLVARARRALERLR